MNLPPCYAPAGTTGARPLHVVDAGGLEAWRAGQPAPVAAWLAAHGFDASAGSCLVIPGSDGAPAAAVIGIGDAQDPCAYAHAPRALPAGDWAPAGESAAEALRALQLGWGLGSYAFTRYRDAKPVRARLALAELDAETLDVLAATVRVRDLVNTPTQDMGPDELEDVARAIAQVHGAGLTAITGGDLLAQNFPAIHAVGRASHRAPRLLALRWGDASHPHVAIVGKGVCFDTGGLDIKPADGMRNMKKDMGGAAHAIALAELVMARRLPLRITLLVPAVENAIGPDAFRPGEVIATRTGVSVEIDNTDAEGRVILGDALAYAGEQVPDLVLDFATLTGAARIALGPDLPALFSNDDALAQAWLDAGMQVRDPLWRMPLWRPYLRYLTSKVADMANAGSKMAGSVTAALYLERFVPKGMPWAHLDTYAWNDSDRPGRPAGGEALGLRAAYAMLKARAGVPAPADGSDPARARQSRL
ncbi:MULTISPECIES: leucyl aminopeptidase family protein [unclassified Luteimonas]|uniref:leucyl aminopeptidase family protein n=1 Tax=unclassified Luteimonas TaxID=2629088 RepID=UPI0018F0860C|nr:MULTISPECIES: leucyl aminopeptidase family protein [unclassified Luteimonas]MBJ6978913.1 leucyl aminopeptidase family protein [Luteimonas sp. MC1895]MBJ6984954.1 leucyl aminopeptidase family protein [Luteimonas sp. MC1750]QQO05628.1 leucyl aminopeptidase family protein [Luteimonas sp. MC1750]